MLEIKIDGEKCKIRIIGNLETICVDAGRAICGVYDALRQSSPEAAPKFRAAITALVNSPDSPLWKKPSCCERTMIDLSGIKRGEVSGGDE